MSQTTIEASENTFALLHAIDCSGHIEKKNGFSYLSWPFAVAELRRNCPDATWAVKRFQNDEPFMHTSCGYFVEVAVTVNGITLSQIHPVLDHRNKPVQSPSAFDINTSIQRCLVKAIALHGLGLSIYAGEDVPPEAKQQRAEAASQTITAEQIKEIEALIDQSGADRDGLCRYFRVNSISELPENRVPAVKQALKNKIDKEAA